MPEPAPESPFRDCTADQVFAEISARLRTDEMRSLWSRIQEELDRSGTDAVATYLDTEFARPQQDFECELARSPQIEK